jgi:hypothetical protein
MPLDYDRYMEEVSNDVQNVLKTAGCQPILFIGSGFSQRYGSAPTWEALLKSLAADCPNAEPYAYYKQKIKDLPQIANLISESYREWAWSSGKEKFPAEYFDEKYPSAVFLKHAAAEKFRNVGPLLSDETFGSFELDQEIAALQKINPHAIVTTNYDRMLEPIFPEYEPVVGQTILRQPYLSIGEIFKIHGCTSDPLSIVLTQDDYSEFEEDKKYLSAKLLTYFAEHPLLFIGYSATDPNIRSVLHDVDRMIRANFDLIPNIYILEWDPTITKASYPARDRVLAIGENREIRIKSISASSFEWVFKSFSSGAPLEKVNIKLLRSLLARTVDLVRKDVPARRVEIDFQTLDHKLGSKEGVATLLGIASIGDASKVNIQYPYTISEVADQLGFKHWDKVRQTTSWIKTQTGFDIFESDNTYHITMRTGKGAKSKTNKYSQAFVDLLLKVNKGESYVLAADCKVEKSNKAAKR